MDLMETLTILGLRMITIIFTSNGNLFVRKEQSFDTATYLLLSSSKQVNILYSYVGGIHISGNAAQPYNIINLTLNHLTLTLQENGPTSEGYIHRVINLQK